MQLLKRWVNDHLGVDPEDLGADLGVVDFRLELGADLEDLGAVVAGVGLVGVKNIYPNP